MQEEQPIELIWTLVYTSKLEELKRTDTPQRKERTAEWGDLEVVCSTEIEELKLPRKESIAEWDDLEVVHSTGIWFFWELVHPSEIGEH